MRWGNVKPYSELVFFSGETERTTLALAGSMRHVISAQKGLNANKSTLFSILPELEKYSAEIGVPSDVERSLSKPSDQRTLMTIDRFASFAKGPVTPLEFLGKRLVEGSLGSKHILLGTPIYVADSD